MESNLNFWMWISGAVTAVLLETAALGIFLGRRLERFVVALEKLKSLEDEIEGNEANRVESVRRLHERITEVNNSVTERVDKVHRILIRMNTQYANPHLHPDIEGLMNELENLNKRSEKL